MFMYYLKGTVAEIVPGFVILDCGGIGFECAASSYTISQLHTGDQVKLYTYCSMREDAFDIFGFTTKEERTCFEQLISVNGVGPKAAIAILSVVNPSGFRLAVCSGDERALTAAPGVGKKLAQRILLELKDKLSLDGSDYRNAESIQPAAANDLNREASAALAQLGYSQSEIANALKQVPKEVSGVSDIVRFALRSMVMKG